MISDSVTYLKDSDEAIRTILVGGVLSLLSFLLLPAFVVAGYLVRVLQRTMAGDDEAPAFEDWGELLVDGVKAFVITLVYGLVPAIVMFVFVGGGIVAAISSNGGRWIGGGSILVGVFLSTVLWLAAWYVIPAATANFAQTGRVRDGFDLGTLRSVLLSRRYATGWLLALGIILLGGIVASALNVVPLLGTIAGVFVGFYAAVAAYHVIGHTWADLRYVETSERETIDDRPVA